MIYVNYVGETRQKMVRILNGTILELSVYVVGPRLATDTVDAGRQRWNSRNLGA